MPPQVQELLASPVQLPSPYLEQAIQVGGFWKGPGESPSLIAYSTHHIHCPTA